MGVDYLTCRCCGGVFPDCGDFVACGDDCSSYWCSTECAEADGYRHERCSEGKDVYDGCIDEEDTCDIAGDNGSCTGCGYYSDNGCKYCREEDFTDTELLEYIMGKLSVQREMLVQEYKNKK